jgi:hypothetical protein
MCYVLFMFMFRDDLRRACPRVLLLVIWGRR